MKLGVPQGVSAKGKKHPVALRSAARCSLGAAPLSGLDLLLSQHCLPSLTQKKYTTFSISYSESLPLYLHLVFCLKCNLKKSTE